MRRYCVKRLCTLIPTLFIISIILFGLVKAMPVDPVAMMMDPHTRPELYAVSYEAKKEELGLNDSLVTQYVRYMQHLMVGDLGYSSIYQRPVKDVIQSPISHTVMLNVIVFILSFSISLVLGVYCSCHEGGWIDRSVQYISVIGISMPSFLLGIIILYLFSIKLHIFPIGGSYDSSLLETIKSMILPILTLTILSVCGLIRYVRNAMMEALSQDYIIALRSRGVSKRRILYVHALRNAMLPIASVVLLQIPNLITGSLLVEVIFSYPGIGTFMIQALMMRDGYLILSMNLLYASLYVITSFLMDICSAYLDPRIRLEDSYEDS